MEKILLDTDIGYDIDDAVALAYLLAQPDCDLLGITTVTGQAEERAMIASALCTEAGRSDIPIYPGSEDPLIVPQMQMVAPQSQALTGMTHQVSFPVGEAIEFMRQTIHAHPGEVTLLAIGPLTNIALLFAVDPQIPELLKQLVMMCGIFKPQQRFTEWNARLDPHAAAMVYRAGVSAHRTIGLDVTQQCIMPVGEVRSTFTKGLLPTVMKFAEVYFQPGKKNMVFHDPLTAATIFDESLCNFERGQIDVALDDPYWRGETIWKTDKFGAHEVALTVQNQRFFEHFYAVFT